MSNQKKEHNFLVQGTILAVASILCRIIGLVYRIPLTNIIGNEGNGIYSAAYEIYSILLLISSYSLPLAVSKLVSAMLAKGQRKNAYKYFKCALLFALVVGVLFAVFTYVTSDFLATVIMATPLSSYSLRVLAPTLLIVAVLGVFRGYFQGLGTMVPTAVSQLLEQIINAVVSIVAAAVLFDMGASVYSADGQSLSTAYGAAGGTLGTCLGAAAGLATLLVLYAFYSRILKRQLKRDKKGYEDDIDVIYKSLLFTIGPVILSTAVYNVSNILDQIVFNHSMSAKGMAASEYNALWGMFSGKYRVLTNVPIAIASALASSIIPSLTRARVQKNWDLVRQKIDYAHRFTMLVVIPCFVGLTVLAGPILVLLWNDTNPIPAGMLRAGSISVVLYAMSTLSNGILQGLNRMRVPVRNAAISLVAHLFILAVLLWVFDGGVFAVVYANIFFSGLMCILNALSIHKYARYRQEVQKTFVLPFLASVIMGAATWLAYFGLEKLTGGKIATILSVFVAVIVYVFALLFTRAVDEPVLRSMPKGDVLIRIAKKLRLM